MIFILLTTILLLQPAPTQAPFSSEQARSVPWEIERTRWVSGKPAVYPSIAAIAHVAGCIYLRIVVSPSGQVDQTAYLGGPALMKESAINSAKTWKFRASKEQVETVPHICFSLPGIAESKALPSDKRADEQSSADPARYIDLARRLLAVGSPDQAESYFRRALDLNPSDAEAAFGLGDSLVAEGDFRGAASAYQALVRPDGPDRAIKQYKRALAAERPSSIWEEPFLHYALGRALETKGEKSHALKEYRTALKQMPWNAAFRDAYGRLATGN